jgi:hypothetical protein
MYSTTRIYTRVSRNGEPAVELTESRPIAVRHNAATVFQIRGDAERKASTRDVGLGTKITIIGREAANVKEI